MFRKFPMRVRTREGGWLADNSSSGWRRRLLESFRRLMVTRKQAVDRHAQSGLDRTADHAGDRGDQQQHDRQLVPTRKTRGDRDRSEHERNQHRDDDRAFAAPGRVPARAHCLECALAPADEHRSGNAPPGHEDEAGNDEHEQPQNRADRGHQRHADEAEIASRPVRYRIAGVAQHRLGQHVEHHDREQRDGELKHAAEQDIPGVAAGYRVARREHRIAHVGDWRGGDRQCDDISDHGDGVSADDLDHSVDDHAGIQFAAKLGRHVFPSFHSPCRLRWDNLAWRQAVSETRPPAWRWSLPPSSSARRANWAAAAPSPLWRISSSTPTGAVVSSAARSAGAAESSAKSNTEVEASRKLERGLPAKPATSSITSAADCTSTAPSRISWLHPWLRASSGEPGTAITSRPASPASRAVISEPDLGAASTTTVPAAIPAMLRLRVGKWLPRGSVPGGCSETSRPRSAMSSCNSACCGG